MLQQVGTVVQARRAQADGVDGLIAQGREAGGHLLGEEPALDALAHLLAVAGDRPVLVAGGIHTTAGTRAALRRRRCRGRRDALSADRRMRRAPGLQGARARRPPDPRHPLFSVGWSDRHRVVPNAATDRWCARSERGPAGVVAFNRALAPALQRLPARAATATLSRQHVRVPLFGPAAVLEGMDERLLDVTPLYAGACAAEIDSVIPAGRAVAQLAP